MINENIEAIQDPKELLVQAKLFEKFVDEYVIGVRADENGTIESVSMIFLRVLGYKSRDVIGKPIGFFVHKDSYEELDAALKDVVQTKKEWRGELKLITVDGRELLLEATMLPVLDNKKDVKNIYLSGRDVTLEHEVEKLKAKKTITKSELSLLDFMPSISAAVLLKKSQKISWVVKLTFLLVFALFIWATMFDVDTIVRGNGKIIPSQQLQVVQSLDGGIVTEIFVKEGDIVKPGDQLVRVSDMEFSKKYEGQLVRMYELEAKVARLRAQASDIPFEEPEDVKKNRPDMLEREKNFYLSKKAELQNAIAKQKEQLAQRQGDLREATEKKHYLDESVKMLQKEIDLKEGLVKKKVVPELEFLQLKRQANDFMLQLKTEEANLRRNSSLIAELKNAISETIYRYKNESQKEMNEAFAEIERIKKENTTMEDKVKRTIIRSSVEGQVKKIYSNTIGGVIQPGRDILEIVPTKDSMLAEIKVRPADIAFLHIGQESILKFTAYEYAVYGGVPGKIVYISPDTIKEQQGKESEYVIYIKPEVEYIGKLEDKHPVKIGMVVNADIKTGKKTILDYIMRPILKTQQAKAGQTGK